MNDNEGGLASAALATPEVDTQLLRELVAYLRK